jgi:hypothetical protein
VRENAQELVVGNTVAGGRALTTSHQLCKPAAQVRLPAKRPARPQSIVFARYFLLARVLLC